MASATPIYPRPTESRVAQAVAVIFEIVEYIAPGEYVTDDVLLRACVARGASVAQAMWALHELTEEFGFSVYARGEAEMRTKSIVTKEYAPAGLEMAKGEIHMKSFMHDWGDLVFLIDHQRLHQMQAATTRPDIKSDTPKKEEKSRRPMNRAAADCARRFKAAKLRDPSTKMTHIIEAYVEKQGGSVQSIKRILNDNPDQWKSQKDDKKAT